MEERKELPYLCAIKLVPLTALRVATVVLALSSLTLVERFCQPSAAKLSGCLLLDTNNGAEELNLCPFFTVGTISILAYTHLVEMFTVGVVVLLLTCKGVRAKQKKFVHWLTMTKWVSNRRKRRRPVAVDTAQLSDGSWWHCFCRCCCACTTCFTCCLFGGSEVVKSSSRSGVQTSSLLDISLVLADYFDTGSAGSLDVTPSDLRVGLIVLISEQRRLKEKRFADLKAEMDQSKLLLFPSEGDNVDGDYDGVEAVRVSDSDDMDIEDEAPGFVAITTFATGSFDYSLRDVEFIDVESVESNEIDSDGIASDKWRCRRDSIVGVNHVRKLQLFRTNSNTTPYFKVATRMRLKKENEYDRCAILDGAHYMRLALAVYGHLMYLLAHTCSAPCYLCTGYLTCRGSSSCCSTGDDRDRAVYGDMMCGCNELAFLRIAGLNHEDLAYASFKTGIHKNPYGIVVDREKKAVVIVIRGTFSLEATVTDLNVRPELLEDYVDKCEALRSDDVKGMYCHGGMLQGALHIFEDLQRHKILDKLLLGDSPRCPGFSLVLAGHSLGAGCAAILSLMLENTYYGVRCLCFAPPGCVMSEQTAAQANFITSYVLDADIIPRISVHSVVGLRNDVLEMIARIKVPKHVALAKDSSIQKETGNLDLIHRRESIPEGTFYQRIREFLEHQEKLKRDRGVNDIKLYPPGKIVHLVESAIGRSKRENATFTPVWATRDDFSEFQVPKSLFFYHDPERILKNLTILADAFR